jgi:hypothetical protein
MSKNNSRLDSQHSSSTLELEDKGYYRIWNRKHLEQLKAMYEATVDISEQKERLVLEQYRAYHEVLHSIEKVIGVLCDQYSDTRDVDADLGGWLALFPKPITEEDTGYIELLKRYHIESSELAEVNEVIATVERELEYVQQIFICNSDYAIIIIYPRLIVSKESEV